MIRSRPVKPYEMFRLKRPCKHDRAVRFKVTARFVLVTMGRPIQCVRLHRFEGNGSSIAMTIDYLERHFKRET